MSEPNNFFVTLLSNACTDNFEDNTLSSFTNKLPQSLSFGDLDKWQVAVHSLGVSAKFDDLHKFNDASLPDFRVIIRARDLKKYKSSTLHNKLESFSKSGDTSHSSFKEKRYEKNFVKSLRRQPLEFMETFSHDHNVFEANETELLRAHQDSVAMENKGVKDLGKKMEEVDSRIMLNTLYFYFVNDGDHEIDISLGKKRVAIENISEQFAIWGKLGIPLKIQADKKEYFTISAIETEADIFNLYGFTLLIHHNAAEKFLLPTNILRETTVYGEKYYCKDFNSKNDVLVGESRNWSHNFPDLIDIECSPVKEEIHNSLLEKRVALVCPSFQNKDVYYTYVADIHNFRPVSNNYLDCITVKLKDLDSNLLPLLPGPASYVKLLFKKMDGDDSFPVKLSGFDNSFNTVLPQPLNLDHSWKCTLTSMSFPGEFLPLPIDENKRKVWWIGSGGVIRALTLPNIQYSKTLLIQVINQFFRRCGISFNLENDRFLVSSERKLNFGFSKSIAHILGFDDELNSGLESNKNFAYASINDHVGVQFKTLNVKNVPLFHKIVNIDYLRPCYLMVYANIIDHSVVGSQYLKLLRNVPVHKHTAYDLHEFKQPEYHGLESTYFDSIDIEIRDHTGELVNFIAKKIVLNIKFSRDKAD